MAAQPEVLDASKEEPRGTTGLEIRLPLAAGRILAPDGSPLQRGAEVRVHWRIPGETGAGWTTPVGLGDAGAFALPGSAAQPTIVLRAATNRHVWSPEVLASVGSANIVLQLREGGRAEGRVLASHDVDPGAFELEIDCVDPANSPDHRVRGWDILPDGQYHVSALMPGRYVVSARLHGVVIGAAEFVIPDFCAVVEVPAIDLRQRVRRLRIHTSTQAPPLAPDAWIGIVAEDDVVAQAEIGQDGHADLLVTDPVVDVVVSAAGRRTERFDGLSDGARIHVREGIPARVHVRGLPVLPVGWAIEYELEAEDEDVLARSSPYTVVQPDALGWADVRLPHPGSYSATVHLHSTDGRAAVLGWTVEHGRPATDLAGLSILTFDLEPASQDAMRSAIRSR